MSILETMAKAVYTVGRFQPPTIGHRMLIDRVLSESKRIGGDAYVFVSSAKGTGKEALRNPLDVKQKIELLKNLFPEGTGVTFVDTSECNPSCGGPGRALGWLIKEKKLDPKNISIVLGAERLAEKNSKEYFGTGASIWGSGENVVEPGSFLRVGHQRVRLMKEPADKEEHMSGTKARGYVTEDRKQIANFYTALGYKYESGKVDVVESVFDAILAVKSGKKVGGEGEKNEEPIPEDDNVISTGPDGELPSGGRVTRRNRASSRALYRRGSRSRTGS